VPGLPFQVDQKKLVMIGGAAGGALLLAVIAFILLRKRQKKTAAATSPAAIAGTAGAASGTQALAVAGMPGTDVEKRLEDQIAEREELQRQMDERTLASLKLAPVITKKAEVFAKHLREKIASQPEISVQILRSWIREEEN
ncbi:MAG TPA: hypothetical protein VNV86_21225, partial [Candidatus Acidoferrum sp.]|nr:hypothetical protein [Candidatus Acidoferrum sp.]